MIEPVCRGFVENKIHVGLRSIHGLQMCDQLRLIADQCRPREFRIKIVEFLAVDTLDSQPVTSGFREPIDQWKSIEVRPFEHDVQKNAETTSEVPTVQGFVEIDLAQHIAMTFQGVDDNRQVIVAREQRRVLIPTPGLVVLADDRIERLLGEPMLLKEIVQRVQGAELQFLPLVIETRFGLSSLR